MNAGMMRGRGGFTLLELLMVLMVISLAGALVYPNLAPHLQRTSREAALRKMSSSLDDLRRQAVAGGKVLVLLFDDEKGRLLLSEEGAGEKSREFGVPEGLEVFSMDPKLLYYFPQGHSSGALLETGDEPGRTVRIEVGSFTGLSRIVTEEP